MSLEELEHIKAEAETRLLALRKKVSDRHGHLTYLPNIKEDILKEQKTIIDCERHIKFINYLNRWH